MNYFNLLVELGKEGYAVKLFNDNKTKWACQATFEMNGKDEVVCTAIANNPEAAIRKLYLEINPIKTFNRTKEPV